MNIAEAIQSIASQGQSVSNKSIKVAQVQSVTGNTCDVQLLDSEFDITGVRLQAETQDGFLCVPAIDSMVIIAPIDDFEYVVVMFSQLDSIKMLDGSYGGLTKTQELKTQLDKTNAVLQAVVDSLKNWTVVANDGGAALKTFFNIQLGVKVVGDYSQIENDKVTHGTV